MWIQFFFSILCYLPGTRKLAFLKESYEISVFICLCLYVVDNGIFLLMNGTAQIEL